LCFLVCSGTLHTSVLPEISRLDLQKIHTLNFLTM
jgi:hypothetical protein